MKLKISQFHFFGSRELNFLYLTLGLVYLGQGLISVFIPIYFWKLGFPIWEILFFYFLISLLFVLLAFFLIPLLRRTSDERMMLLSIPFLIFYYLGLNFVSDNQYVFYILPFLIAVHMVFFNIGYHLNFANAVNGKHVGCEVGARDVIGKLFQFSAPFIGGLIIGFFGFSAVFVVGSIVLFLAVLPLFFVSKRKFPSRLNSYSVLHFLKNKSLRPFNLSAFGYGIETTVGRIAWPLFIFLTIGSVEIFGGVMSIGLFVSMIVAYFAGFLSDAGRRRKVITLSAGFFSFIWATRAFLNNFLPIVGSHIGGHIFNSALMVSWESQYYKIAKFLPTTDIFIFSREIIYNASRILFLPILMLLSYFLPINQFFKFSFILAAIFSLLYLFANRLYLKNLDID